MPNYSCPPCSWDLYYLKKAKLALVVALYRLNPGAEILISLTGRPLKHRAVKGDPNWDWQLNSSLRAQLGSASRMKNFLKFFGIRVSEVFDGGIAPRTLVPHHIHFPDYWKFLDHDAYESLEYPELDPQQHLLKRLLDLPEKSVQVVVGGPMTGLYELVQREPDVVTRFKELHAMFATWGKVALMKLGDEDRKLTQFNVYGDPQAAAEVLLGQWGIPIYLMPTEVTRVKEIGFVNAHALLEALPKTEGTIALFNLYCIWYDAAVRPRQVNDPNEMIYIHDLASALSLNAELRESIYNVVPIDVRVPHRFYERADWGKVFMTETQGETNIFAATGLKEGGAAKYLETLKRIFA